MGSIQIKQYKLLEDVAAMQPPPSKDDDWLSLKAGQEVFSFVGCDYGISSLDSKIIGSRCIPVTLQDDGRGSFLSVQQSYLELVGVRQVEIK